MFNEIKTSKLLTHLKAGAQKNIVCGPERENMSILLLHISYNSCNIILSIENLKKE